MGMNKKTSSPKITRPFGKPKSSNRRFMRAVKFSKAFAFNPNRGT